MKEQVLAVQRMQDYIEQNNAKDISLSDLSKALLFSPWYSYRLCKCGHVHARFLPRIRHEPVPIALFIPYGAKYRELKKERTDVTNIQTVFVRAVKKAGAHMHNQARRITFRVPGPAV